MKFLNLNLKTNLGVSLVELMVAMTIGLFMVLGLTIMLSKSSYNFKVQDDFARMQENGVATLRYIGDDLRQAGFYGMITSNTAPITLPNPIAIAGDCGAGWALNTAQPLASFTGFTAATAAAVFPCINSANFVDQSPILVVRGARGSRIFDPTQDGDLSDATLDTNTIYLQAQPANGILFKGGDFGALKAAGRTKQRQLTLGDNDPALINVVVPAPPAPPPLIDFPIYEYQAHAYYLRPCSRPTGDGNTCQATDDNGSPIPTLVRQELNRLAMQEVPVVEGVERIVLLYGVDINSDRVADVLIETPNAGQWPNVVSVKVSALIRANTPSAGYDDSNKSYNLGGTNNYSVTGGSGCADCTLTGNNYKRHVFTKTFQLHNTRL